MTKLDEERKRKKEIGEQGEILDALGQDSEDKGVKTALELFKKEHQENEQKDILTVEKLDHARKKPFDSVYYRTVLAECVLRMKEYSIPPGFTWYPHISKDGLAIIVQGPDKQRYGGGVKIVGDPFIDAKGTIGLVRQALIDIDLLQNQWIIQSSIKTKN